MALRLSGDARRPGENGEIGAKDRVTAGFDWRPLLLTLNEMGVTVEGETISSGSGREGCDCMGGMDDPDLLPSVSKPATIKTPR
jgi:hypothetical protein